MKRIDTYGQTPLLRVCLYCAFSLLIVSFQAHAATNTTLTLAEAIKKTLNQNPSLNVFPLREQGLQAERETAQLSPAYRVGAELENVAGTGQLSGTQSAELTVSLSSVLELGGKKQARVSVVDQKLALSRIKQQIASIDLLSTVTKNYIQLLIDKQRIQLAEEEVSLAQATADEVNKRVRAAIAPKADYARAVAAVEQARLNVTRVEQRMHAHKMALANLWGQMQPDFNQVSGSLFDYGSSRSFESLFELVKNNPSLEFFAAETRLKESEIRLAKTQQQADIDWSVGLRRSADIDESALVAGFSVPLFAEKRAESAVKSALAARNEITYQQQDFLLRIHSQLYQAYTAREQAINAATTLQQSIIPQLTDALTQTKTAYQRGLYSYLDFLTARQELLNAKRALIEASADALLLTAEIEQLTAEPLLIGQNFEGKNHE
ncbi:TolC family protein [Methylophaga thalassica]|uniref:TolC family protein n=1 Tax=Methylophaga aminisulfidivorans TaxID=230105 RepID=UPI003A8DD93F